MRANPIFIAGLVAAVTLSWPQAEAQESSGAITRNAPLASYQLQILPGWNVIANQLDNGGNTLDEVLPNVPDLVTLYKWENAGAYYVQYTFLEGIWFPEGGTLSPGEGAFLFNPDATSFNLDFSGTQRGVETPASLMPEQFYFLSRQVPAQANYTNIVGSAPFEGVTLYRFNRIGGANPLHRAAPDFSVFVFEQGMWRPVKGLWDPILGLWDPVQGPVMNVGEPVFIGPRPVEIRGVVFNDANGDGVRSNLVERGLPNRLVKLQTEGLGLPFGPYYTLTDLEGEYGFAVPLGSSNILSAVPVPGWTQTFPVSPPVHYVPVPEPPPGNVITGITFGIRAAELRQDLGVVLNAIYPVGRGSPCCGTGLTYVVSYFNQGTRTMHGVALDVVRPAYTAYASFTASPSLPPPEMQGDLMRWTLPGGLTPGSRGIIYVQVMVECPDTNDPPVLAATARINPIGGDANPVDNISSHAARADCGEAASDKRVSPTGCGPTHAIGPQQLLDYVIEFQNTGSAPSDFISVQDSLDNDLDLASVKVLGASHPGFVEQVGQELTWVFPNIHLPPATADDRLSRGFIRFQARPRSDAATGVQIHNQATVHFDFNPPVVTAMTLNTISDALLPSANFVVSNRCSSAGHTNDFTYTGGTMGAGFFWDFGPGAVPTTSTQQNPLGVRFTNPGQHNVTLQVLLGDCRSEAAVHTLQAGPPSLSISQNTTNVFVMWLADGYDAEETGSLEPSILWQPANGSESIVAGTHVLTIPFPTNMRFYRLRDDCP